MKISELARIKDFHHAYLVTGSAGRGAPEVLAMLETRGVKTAGNPDVLPLSFTELSVEDARTIASFASLRSLGGEKYLVITSSRATTEAQNALLKVTEEAPGGSIFFFCVDSAGHLLPTLRSRAIEVSISAAGGEEREEAKEARTFLGASFEERLKVTDAMAAAVTKTKDRNPVRAFVRELISVIHQNGGASPATLRDLLDADKYLRLSGASVKSILGHLAVSLPRKR